MPRLLTARSLLIDGFTWGDGLDRESMDPISQKSSERIIDETVPGKATLPYKPCRDDQDAEVAFAGAWRTRVAGMKM
jgi:hypothetical protein